jgi:hypothetical protein
VRRLGFQGKEWERGREFGGGRKRLLPNLVLSLSLSLRATMAKERTFLSRTQRRMVSRHGRPLHSWEEGNETRKDIFTLGGNAKSWGQPPHGTVRFYDHGQPRTRSL